MEMDETPSDSETTALTDTVEISSNIDVHPIIPRDQSLPRLVKEVHSFTSLSQEQHSSISPATRRKCPLTMIVLQHNCNGTAVLIVAALEAAIKRGAEVACLQEPYVGKKHTISHPSFQIRWPEYIKQDTRVALAIRNDALDRYVFEERTDLVDSPHVQCLDV